MPDKPEKLWSYEPVPSSALRLFQMAWQLENWLRSIVYVELRASRPDWEEPIKAVANDWPPQSQNNDKRLHHMATPHQGALSFLTFGQLWNVVTANWSLFDDYFPPEANTAAKIEEIKTVRNRVAHFREPHQRDEARFRLFLQDLDGGVRRFCIRYSSSYRGGVDPVAQELAEQWEHVGHGCELQRPDVDWLYAPGKHRMEPVLHGRLDFLARKRLSGGTFEGGVYRLHISGGMRAELNVRRVLESTQALHSEVIHVLVTADRDLDVTVPSLFGTHKVVELLAAFLKAGVNAAWSSWQIDLRGIKTEWPEYVLWPDHVLSFFHEDYRGPIFELPDEE